MGKMNEPGYKKVKVEMKERDMHIIVVLYISGLSEQVTTVMKDRRISTDMKSHHTLQNLLIHTNDKIDPMEGVQGF